MDINQVLRELAQERPIFSSEADFQHALASIGPDSEDSSGVSAAIHPNVLGYRC
jgi:hypothetical protein